MKMQSNGVTNVIIWCFVFVRSIKALLMLSITLRPQCKHVLLNVNFKEIVSLN